MGPVEPRIVDDEDWACGRGRAAGRGVRGAEGVGMAGVRSVGVAEGRDAPPTPLRLSHSASRWRPVRYEWECAAKAVSTRGQCVCKGTVSPRLGHGAAACERVVPARLGRGLGPGLGLGEARRVSTNLEANLSPNLSPSLSPNLSSLSAWSHSTTSPCSAGQLSSFAESHAHLWHTTVVSGTRT